MKLLKFLFSRMFLTLLAFIIQIGLIGFLIVVLGYSSIWVYFVCVILGLIVLFSLINKKEPPEYKLTWSIIMLILPILGVVLYLLYANPKMTKQDYKKILKVYNNCKPYFQLEPITRNKDDKYDNYKGICKYLYELGGIGSFGNKVKFLNGGESFFEELKASLEKAKKYIFLQFFIIHEGKIWDDIMTILERKANEGVEVRVMFDDFGSFGNPRSFYKRLKESKIDFTKFNQLRPTAAGSHNNRDHRKIAIIDGKVAFTGGINIGDEYANVIERFGRWKDSGIKIEGPATHVLMANFLMLNDTADKKHLKKIESISERKKDLYKKYFDEKPKIFKEDGYVQPFGDGPKPFYPEKIAENNYINLINSAKKYLWITTPYLIPDFKLLSAIRESALRGVDVRIITPHIPDKKMVFNVTRSNYSYLMEAGVKIYEYTPGFIHSKQLLVDDSVAFIGTVNLDYRSLAHHFECGVNLYNTPCLKALKKDFNDIFKVSEVVKLENIKMGVFTRIITSIANLFAPML